MSDRPSNGVAFGVEPFNRKVCEKLRPELRQRRLQTPAGSVGLAILWTQVAQTFRAAGRIVDAEMDPEWAQSGLLEVAKDHFIALR